MVSAAGLEPATHALKGITNAEIKDLHGLLQNAMNCRKLLRYRRLATTAYQFVVNRRVSERIQNRIQSRSALTLPGLQLLRLRSPHLCRGLGCLRSDFLMTLWCALRHTTEESDRCASRSC